MARSLDGAIAERSLKQLGLLTHDELDDLGVTRAQRRRLLGAGVLQRVCPGVVRHTAHPISWEQLLLAAVLAGGAGAVASHMAAAALWRFDSIRPGAVEITVPFTGRSRVALGEGHRSRRLDVADIVTDRLIRRTTPARTILDIAPRLTRAQLEEVVDGAARDGQIRRAHLQWRLDQLPLHRGHDEVQALLDRTEGRDVGDSWLEQEAMRLIDAARLVRPRCQVKKRKVGGGIARVDLIWDDRMLIVELMGHGTHATRRQRQHDAERRARLELLGFRVPEFTYEDVRERPDYFISMLIAHLELGGLCAKAVPGQPVRHTTPRR
jgi:very-short-patch-repair endonuclease